MSDPITVRIDTSRLDEIAANLGVRSDRIVAMAANEVVANAVGSFGTGFQSVSIARVTVDENGLFSNDADQQTRSAPGQPPNVDTGALRASVHASRTGRNQYTVSDGVEYGAYLEYGTPKMAARPWLGPSVFQMMQTFNKRWKGLFE